MKKYRLFTNWAARQGAEDSDIFEQDFPTTASGIADLAECLLDQEVCWDDWIEENTDPQLNTRISRQAYLEERIKEHLAGQDVSGSVPDEFDDWRITEVDDPLPDLQAKIERLESEARGMRITLEHLKQAVESDSKSALMNAYREACETLKEGN